MQRISVFSDIYESSLVARLHVTRTLYSTWLIDFEEKVFSQWDCNSIVIRNILWIRLGMKLSRPNMVLPLGISYILSSIGLLPFSMWNALVQLRMTWFCFGNLAIDNKGYVSQTSYVFFSVMFSCSLHRINQNTDVHIYIYLYQGWPIYMVT